MKKGLAVLFALLCVAFLGAGQVQAHPLVSFAFNAGLRTPAVITDAAGNVLVFDARLNRFVRVNARRNVAIVNQVRGVNVLVAPSRVNGFRFR